MTTGDERPAESGGASATGSGPADEATAPQAAAASGRGDDATAAQAAATPGRGAEATAAQAAATPGRGAEATAAQAAATPGTGAEATPPQGGSEPPGPEGHDGSATRDSTDAETPKGPRVVRRVVCSYRLGWLPGDWLQTWRRLDRVFARANLKVKATLAPLEDLPADTDILVVPPDLREAAREAVAPGTPILVTPASAAAGAFNDLVARLEAGTEMTAEKIDEAERNKPKIVSYRGHTLID